MAGFGAVTDPWGFAETGINLLSSGSSQQGSNAQCPDSLGNVIEETVYDTGSAPTATYLVCAGKTATFYDSSDTSSIIDFRLGKVISNNAITGIVATRSNTDELQLTISGENSPLGDTALAKFTPVFPSGYLAGGKAALEAGIVSSAGRVISSSVTGSLSVSKGLDSQGAQACKSTYAGRMEANNEFMSCDTLPAAVADTANGWALNPSTGAAEINTGYPTATFDAFQNLAQDT